MLLRRDGRVPGDETPDPSRSGTPGRPGCRGGEQGLAELELRLAALRQH
ncbi:hypothetical protein VULLAG_LOCUS770 [Vulpes lagopus]